jgi:hypothetical protein
VTHPEPKDQNVAVPQSKLHLVAIPKTLAVMSDAERRDLAEQIVDALPAELRPRDAS